MFVRVTDRATGKHFKSIVYGLLNCGYYEEAIVLNPLGNCFEIISYFDRSKTGKDFDPFQTGYEIIHPDRGDWITAGAKELHILKPVLSRTLGCGVTAQMTGYEDVFSDVDKLVQFLNQRSIPAKDAWFSVRQLPDIQEWKYISTQEDADAFMDIFAGFHDSTLNKMIYEEENQRTKLTATFDNRGWYGIVELCFEGVTEIHIRPPKENRLRDICCAMLRIVDEMVVWADDWCENIEDIQPDWSCVKALSLKWRRIE